MKVPHEREERPVSWLAIPADTPIQSADDETVGAVREVLGSQAEDIFHGVVATSGSLGHDVLIPAGTITSLTNLRVSTSLTSTQIRNLEPYLEEHSYHLGFVGILGKRLGWVEERNER